MHCVRQITQDLYWVGGSDRRLALFENVYPIPGGVSVRTALVYDGELSPSVEACGWFDHLVPAARLFET